MAGPPWPCKLVPPPRAPWQLPPGGQLCKRRDCPHYRQNPRDPAPRWHGYCCNACREDRGHTPNCSGGSRQTAAALEEDPDRRRRDRGRWNRPDTRWAPPLSWLYHSDHSARTFQERLRLLPAQGAEELGPGWGVRWQVLDELSTTEQREVVIHARSCDWEPDMPWIDLEPCDLAGARREKRLTGFDVPCLISLMRSPDIVRVLVAAAHEVEKEDASDFCFRCRGGTHRSVGCAVLLLLLVYPGARVAPHTPRTQGCARSTGWRLA